MKTPNYAPVYCAALYPDLCEIFRKHGYALAVHCSLARDFDLVAIPWADDVSGHAIVIGDVLKEFAATLVGEMGEKPHGRVVYTVSFGFGECACDLSFMPMGDGGKP